MNKSQAKLVLVYRYGISASHILALVILKLRYKQLNLVYIDHTREATGYSNLVLIGLDKEFEVLTSNNCSNRFIPTIRDFLPSDYRKTIWTSVPLGCAGYYWAKFGTELVYILRGKNEKLSSKDMGALLEKIYFNFICEFDADFHRIAPSQSQCKYSISTSLPDLINAAVKPETDCVDDRTVQKCMERLSHEFLAACDQVLTMWFPSQILVKESYLERLTVDASGQIMIINRFCPFLSHLMTIESDALTGRDEELSQSTLNNASGRVLIVIIKNAQDRWTLHCVRDNKIGHRITMPTEWRGLTEKDLDNILQLRGSLFVHGNGYIGAHSTKEGAIQMARLTIFEKQLG